MNIAQIRVRIGTARVLLDTLVGSDRAKKSREQCGILCDAILRAQNMDHADKVDLAAFAMKVQWEDADAATLASAMAELCPQNRRNIWQQQRQ